MKKLPKLPEREKTEAERWRRFVWEDGDIVLIKNPEPPKKSGATKKRSRWPKASG